MSDGGDRKQKIRQLTPTVRGTSGQNREEEGEMVKKLSSEEGGRRVFILKGI